MIRIKKLLKKTIDSLKEYGFRITIIKTINYIKRIVKMEKTRDAAEDIYADVLFINGCYLPHPSRYRVEHQREQLFANGIVSSEVLYENITMSLVKQYRIFIFFRCPITEEIRGFINLAKKSNKTVLFDIDDLVIDKKYTDEVKYLNTMSEEERKNYDNGVNRMRETLLMCDGAITTTERLANELKNYVPEVFINRNTASQYMVKRSLDAVKKRDIFPYLSTDNVSYKEKLAIKRAQESLKQKETSQIVSIGYFSGSITHNDDFNMIIPVIVRLMDEFPNIQLHIVGELDVPDELEKYSDRIVALPFMAWQKLPEVIASVDINIVPLEQTIFNEAKSENKWVEAALVKVPTVASNVGAFEKMVRHNVTGILCDTNDEWYEALKLLIAIKDKRNELAENAYNYVIKNCTTIYSGRNLAEHLKSRMAPNIVFAVPSTKISGGILVVLKHCMLLKKAGYDVLLLNEDVDDKNVLFEGCEINCVSRYKTLFHGHIDKAVATLWTTVGFLKLYPNIFERYYLVQGFEPDFYEYGNLFKPSANTTYCDSNLLNYITISAWCKRWLEEDYGQTASYAPNGLDTNNFRPKKRDFSSNKIRILVEGNCDDFYKNIDESFKIVEGLDKSRFEIWFMSYQGEPKKWYHVDEFLHRVPYDKVPEIYRKCHILLKSSILESFSYPPLEMMATGGYAVVAPNDGNREYLVNEENCLFYEQGNIESGIAAIHRIINEADLRERLYENGLRTANARDWNNLENQILRLYNVKPEGVSDGSKSVEK